MSSSISALPLDYSPYMMDPVYSSMYSVQCPVYSYSAGANPVAFYQNSISSPNNVQNQILCRNWNSVPVLQFFIQRRGSLSQDLSQEEIHLSRVPFCINFFVQKIYAFMNIFDHQQVSIPYPDRRDPQSHNEPLSVKNLTFPKISNIFKIFVAIQNSDISQEIPGLR